MTAPVSPSASRASALDRIPVPDVARKAWTRWKTPLIRTGVVYLVIAAAGRLIYGLPYLVADRADWSALDLGYRYEEVQRWFAGLPVYGELERLLYPPASYSVLWPFLGWLPFDSARLLWAVSTLGAACAIALVMYAATAAHPLRERLLIALLAFAAFPVQISILVGQLPVHAVAFLAAAAYLVTRDRVTWWSDCAGGILLAASIVKPTLTVPLAAATLIAARRWRPALLAAAAYGLLAFVAAAAQPGGPVGLYLAWLESTGTPSLIAEGVPNLHLWLAQLGRESWAAPASAIVLLVFCAWCWRSRHADPWVLIGAAAVVARLWAYHREYDDVILVLATIGLLRMAGSREASSRVLPGVLLAAAWATLLTPTWAIYDLPPGVVLAIQWTHTIVWLAVLAFFVLAAEDRSTHPHANADPASGPAPVRAG